MPTRKQRFLALLATARAANLPTVATHVMVGLLLGFRITDSSGALGGFTPLILLSVLLGCSFYVGGCLLGDAVDTRFDSEHRPERPIPQGILSARTIATSGCFTIFVAWLISCLTPLLIAIAEFNVPLREVIPTLRADPDLIALVFPWPHLASTTALAGSILAYAKFHKPLGKLAPILMAVCRALLVIWAASPAISIRMILSSTKPDLVIFAFAAATFLYTLTLSLVARHESNPNAKLPGLPLKILLVVPPFLLAGIFVINDYSLPLYARGYSVAPREAITLIIAFLLFLAWCLYAFTRLKHSIPAFVSCALAGFCLMDACFAALIGWPVALACLLLFLLALLLQRIAPAT